MSFSKIAPIVLYVVIGITILVMLIFYAGSSFVDEAEYNSKVSQIENPAVESGTSDIMQDLRSADSLAVSDSIAVTGGDLSEDISQAVAGQQVKDVNLTFMEKLAYFKTDLPIIWSYILIIIALIVTVVFPVVYIFIHPTNLIRSLLVLVGVAIIIGLAYLIASGAPIHITGYTGDINSKPFALKMIDTGLIFTYFILGIALLSILLSQVVNYFK